MTQLIDAISTLDDAREQLSEYEVEAINVLIRHAEDLDNAVKFEIRYLENWLARDPNNAAVHTILDRLRTIVAS